MKIKLIAISLGIFMLSGCAALEQMHEQWVRENCNPGAAFNTGLADGLSPGTMPKTNYASSCPGNPPQFNDAYMRGFSQGLSKRPQQININKNVNVNRPEEKNKAVSGYSSATPHISLEDKLRIEQMQRQRELEEMRRQSAEARANANRAINRAHRVLQQAHS